MDSMQYEWILNTIDCTATVAAAILIIIFLGRISRGDAAQRLIAVSPRPNRIAEDSVLVGVLAYFLSASLLGIIFRPSEHEEEIWRILLVDNGARLFGAAMCLAIISQRFTGGVRRFFSPEPGPLTRHGPTFIIAGLLVALGVCPWLIYVGLWIIRGFRPDFEPIAHPTISRLEEGASTYIVAWLWISAALIAPIAEEIFFRGMLQNAIVNLVGNRWRAVVLTSLAFGAVHFTQPQAVIPLVFLGVILGYSYERSASILVPISIHALFNLKTLIYHALGASQ